MVPSDDDDESDKSDDDGGFSFVDGTECGFDFLDPLEETRRARAQHKAPRLDMPEEEALVDAIVASEAEMHTAMQIKHDAELARQLELDEVLESRREAAAKHRKQFARRWQCALFFYDAEKLRSFCKQYDLPFASKTSAPVPWADRVRRFSETQNYSVYDLGIHLRPFYSHFASAFRKKTGAEWRMLCPQPSLLSAQYLMTHVHLCYVQDRGNVAKIADVVGYVYDDSTSGSKPTLLAEAAKWLAVLVQVAMKFGIHYAFDRQAVAMILRQLLELRVDNRSIGDELEQLKPFIEVPTDADGCLRER